MKGIFSHLGILERVVSDNQTCFRSAEYVQFAKDWDFEDVTSSQHHSQGNGFSEAYVKIYKCIFTKAKSINTDPFISLLEYRNAKLSSTNFSPATLLMSRELRSILPLTEVNSTDRKRKIETICYFPRNSLHKATYFDRRTKPLEPLKLGGSAHVQNMQNKTWQQAVITDKHNDRSYSVHTSDGATYRFNRRHLIKMHVYQNTQDVEMHIPEETSPLVPQLPEVQQPSIPTKTRSGAAKSDNSVYIIH